MDNIVISAIKNCTIFASLDVHSEVFQALIKQGEFVELAEDAVLFHQGDYSDSIYLLIEGRLTVILNTPESKPKIIGYILPNDTVGELGALTDDPRSATIIALEKSRLLKISNVTFKKLCRQYPAVSFAVISRSQQIIQSLFIGEKKKHIAIIPANHYVNPDLFENHLREVLSHTKKIALLSESKINSDKKDLRSLENLLTETEKNNSIILYLLNPYETALSKLCWNKIGKIYIIVDGNTRPHFDNFVLEKLHNSKHIVEIRRELILLYRENDIPYNTQEWLNKADFFQHHQIREEFLPDYQRLLRYIREKTFGLVLSGGGARGWAHIGAMRAILESNIPIDAIGGTSVGAIIGALFIMNQTYEEIHQNFESLVNTVTNIISWRHFCWPAISLFDCKEFTLEAKRIFGNKKIENLWLPYFCITCNLGRYKEIAHRRGLLWEKNRGSVSVPGLVPPIVIDGELHIDGGVVNNLPVNIMRELLGASSNIIAVELLTDLIDNNRYDFPSTLTFREAFLAKLGIAHRDYRFPRFIETFLKSLLVGASVKQKENSLSADLLIAPDVTGNSMIHTPSQETRNLLIEIGYRSAVEKLKTWDIKK